MGLPVRISVGSERNPAKAGEAINALERRLQKQSDDHLPGREEWGPPERIPHVPEPGDHETQSALSDIVLEFLREDLASDMAKDAVKAALAYLVWTVVSHLKSQPDPEQVVVVSVNDTRVELRASGMTEEAVARAGEELATRLRQAAEQSEEPPPSHGD